MKKLLGGLLSCILGGWLLTACTSDDDLQQIPEGKGYVKLALNTNTGFQTKAVDESYYSKKRKLYGNHHKKRRKRSRATMEIQRDS